MTYSAPKYYQISQRIIKQIKNGKFQEGDKITSENEMIKNFNISNTTARKVLQELEIQGYVKKMRGKGPFVKKPFVDISVNKILSFTKSMTQAGFNPSTKLIEAVVIHEDVTQIINKKEYTLEKPILKLKRLRLADGIPMMIEELFISLHHCNGIEKFDLESSITEIYKNEFNLHITKIEQNLSSIILNKKLLDFFGLKKSTSGFTLEGVLFSQNNILIEIEKSIYRGDRTKFFVQAT